MVLWRCPKLCTLNTWSTCDSIKGCGNIPRSHCTQMCVKVCVLISTFYSPLFLFQNVSQRETLTGDTICIYQFLEIHWGLWAIIPQAGLPNRTSCSDGNALYLPCAIWQPLAHVTLEHIEHGWCNCRTEF